jgi:hypothetical protein
MIKVIWSDDFFEDSNQVRVSTELAYERGIILVAKQTWDVTQQELEDSGEAYDAVILDGKGQKSIDSKTNDTSHITQAIGWLREQRGKGHNYPIIVYTGNHEIISELYEDDTTILAIIQKPNMEDVYDKIKIAVADSQNTKIKQKYSDSWQVFNNNILSTGLEQKLLGIIKKHENQNTEKSDFNTIREIFEGLLKRFNEIDSTDNLLPNDVSNSNGTINLEWSIRILKGDSTNIRRGNTLTRVVPTNTKPVIPAGHHIGYCFDFIKATSSAFSHRYSHEYGETTFPACLFALMEILRWANTMILDKYEDRI